jgi:hypothetical protein
MSEERVFVVRRGNAKQLLVRLRGSDRKPQALPAGTVVTFTMWRTLHDRAGSMVLDHVPGAVQDDGTSAKMGWASYDFTAVSSAAIPRDVYFAQFDALVGGVIPLTFPDDDAEPLLVKVTD